MDEKKEEGTCGKGGCGVHCGCCVCKAIKGLVLLLIGGVIGFFIGRCCGRHGMCPMPASASAPAAGAATTVEAAIPRKAK
jgi:hypothetical protein